MTKLNRVLWALIFVGVATFLGKVGWDHFQEGVNVQKQLDAVVTLDAGNIGTVIKDGVPTMILTCTPDICEKMRPLVVDLEKKFGNKISIALLDAYANGDLAQQLLAITVKTIGKDIPMAFPTAVVLDKTSKPIVAALGIHSADEYSDMLAQVLGITPAVSTADPVAPPEVAQPVPGPAKDQPGDTARSTPDGK